MKKGISKNISNQNLMPVIIIKDETLAGKEASTQGLLIKKVADYSKAHGRDVQIVPHTELEQVIENGRIADRLKSTCYLGGARLGIDPELPEQIQALASAVSNAGFHTVYPGSAAGMMGVLAKAVIDAGKPLTSIFSLPVAAATVEELEMRATSILVFPDETMRQVGYHLLSSSQIALPGGTGTDAEASIHFYKNVAMDVLYRHPDIFKEDGIVAPIIYYSPQTAKIIQEFKAAIAASFPKAVAEAILRTPVKDIQAGYWTAKHDQFRIMQGMGFVPGEHLLFIGEARTPQEAVSELERWGDPLTRQMAVASANAHYAKARENIMELHSRRGIYRAPAA